MSWYKRQSENTPGAEKKERIGVYVKCDRCDAMLYKKDLSENAHICIKCGYHFRVGAEVYLKLLLDENTFEPLNANMTAADPLGFVDSRPYHERIRSTMEKTGLKEAVQTGIGKIGGRRIVIAVMDFAFIGGSMGSVVGEKIARAVDQALACKTPLIIISASGGARMMEGALSLMQMAKTAARLALLRDARLPYISILTDPTTGGVTASFAMLGDLNIAEPGALIGFAGPRVIKEATGKDLPNGFQRAEFLLDHGFIDRIVPRNQLRNELIVLFPFFDYYCQ